MVREWGMSEEIGPMAWGSQGQVFLGEDLMHTRDYSEDTSRVIDDEVERILRTQEERAMELLTLHRAGLDAVAHALLDLESIDGEEVGRLVDEAFGGPVHTDGPKAKTIRFQPSGNGKRNGNGTKNGNGHTPSAALPAAGADLGTAVTVPHGSAPAPLPGSAQAPAGHWPPPWPGQQPGGPQQPGQAPVGPPPQWPSGPWPPPQDGQHRAPSASSSPGGASPGDSSEGDSSAPGAQGADPQG